MGVGLTDYSGKGVNVSSILAKIIPKTQVSKTTNAFNTNGNTYIQSGQSTSDIITNIKTLQNTTISNTNTALNAAIQSINTNFKTIGEALGKIGTPNAAAQPQTTVPASPGSQNNQSPTQPDNTHSTDQILASLDKVKHYIGPTGLVIGAVFFAVVLLRRK